jgi:hypothetical protein
MNYHLTILALSISLPTHIHAEEAPPTVVLEGTWKWAASAYDDNKNGKPDEAEWKYRDAKVEKEFRDIGMDVDNNQFHLEADGNGYSGKTKDPDDLLTWKKLGENQVVISCVGESAANATTYSFTAKGELLLSKTQELKILNSTVTVTTFELYRKS